MNEKSFKIRRLAVNGILAALIIVVSFLPIRIGTVEITLSMIPIAVGASIYGVYSGALLGAVFGTVSFLQCLGYSPFGATLLAVSVPVTLLMCIPTRILAGALAGLACDIFKKSGHKNIGIITAGVLAPVLNTVFFTGVMLIGFWNTEYIQGFAEMFKTPAPFAFAVAFVGLNGLIEILVGIAVAIPAAKAISHRIK
ncbi:MAG: ECF transporter S component [Clostridiales bacterium]|nr:ECF transporter S component [Candidatus Equinaster intestinalis]